jgi:hypothetical protein
MPEMVMVGPAGAAGAGTGAGAGAELELPPQAATATADAATQMTEVVKRMFPPECAGTRAHIE